MGQFSWIYSDTHKQLVNDKIADTYLLVPKPFRRKYGTAIYESCYDGYGHFGEYDIYMLIAEWNRKFIPQMIEKIKEGQWRNSCAEQSIELLDTFFRRGKASDEDMRWVGILMACHNKDNAALPYPIKITTKEMVYEDVEPSLSDPNQGW